MKNREKNNEGKIRRMVKVVTLDGAIFTGEITGNNSRGIFLNTEQREDFSNSVFVSHKAISHLESLGWKK